MTKKRRCGNTFAIRDISHRCQERGPHDVHSFTDNDHGYTLTWTDPVPHAYSPRHGIPDEDCEVCGWGPHDDDEYR